MKKYQNKYRIPSARLQGYDYGSNGFYYVTICTKNRVHYFGDIVATGNRPSQNVVSRAVETHNCASQKRNSHPTETHNCAPQNDSPNHETHNCAPQNDSPNHETHNCASLRPTIIGQTAIDYWSQIPEHYPFVELDEFVVMPNHIHGILFFNRPDKIDWTPNQFGVQSKNLGAVIRAFKSSLKRFANENNIEFEWQSRFHDRIIRDEKALNAIRRYIMNNPLKWANDALNMPNVETGHLTSLHQIIEHETDNLLNEMVE